MPRALPIVACSCLLLVGSGHARADHVVLVGGTTLDGKVRREGKRVVVELDSGEVTLPADSVQRIEQGPSVVARFEERYEALRPRDVRARLELADYCRDHHMAGRERRLLEEVVELDPNNATARRRLGFVRTDAGWVTQADAQRAQGLVERDGKWVSPGEATAMDREQAEKLAAARQKEEQAAEARAAARNAERAERAARVAELEAARAQAYARPWGPSVGYGGFGPSYGFVYGPTYSRTGYVNYDACGYAGRCGPSSRPVSPGVPWNAFDPSSMSVVKVPYRHP